MRKMSSLGLLGVAAAIAAPLALAGTAQAAPTSLQPSVTTTNWTGWQAQTPGKKMGSVAGTFTVPYADACNYTDQYGDTSTIGWFAGLGGYGSNSDALAGVTAYCNYATNTTKYVMSADFRDNYGLGNGPSVNAGDVIQSAVGVNAKNVYTMTVKDLSTTRGYAWNATCPKNTVCYHATGEWVTANVLGDSNQTGYALAYFQDPQWRNLSGKLTGTTRSLPPTSFGQYRPLAMESSLNPGLIVANVGPLYTNHFATSWLSSYGPVRK